MTEEEKSKVDRPRNAYPRQLCEDSPFGQMLKAPEALAAPQTTEAELFRKRFRLPYQVFLELTVGAVAKTPEDKVTSA